MSSDFARSFRDGFMRVTVGGNGRETVDVHDRRAIESSNLAAVAPARKISSICSAGKPFQGSLRRPSSPWCNSICIRTAIHPGWLRCSSLKYSRLFPTMAAARPGGGYDHLGYGTLTFTLTG